MQVDQALLQAALIFLPGLIWASLDRSYAQKGAEALGWFILKAFLFGVIAYVLLVLCYWLTNVPSPLLETRDARAEMLERVRVLDVAAASGLSLPLAILWLYIRNKKIITRILQAIDATHTYGDEDVWDYIFNSANNEIVEYVHVRDFEKQLVYSGWVRVFSESAALRELYLRDVEISDFEGNTLYEMPWVYLARAPDDITLEFPRRADTKIGLEDEHTEKE